MKVLMLSVFALTLSAHAQQNMIIIKTDSGVKIDLYYAKECWDIEFPCISYPSLKHKEVTCTEEGGELTARVGLSVNSSVNRRQVPYQTSASKSFRINFDNLCPEGTPDHVIINEEKVK